MKKNKQQKKYTKNTNTEIAKDWQNSIFPLIVVFCIPVLLYIQTLSFDFTYFDDNNIIINNTTFLSQFDNFSQAFKTDAFMKGHGHFYRPLQTVSYMTDIFFSGNNTWMFHLTNVLLLGLIAVLLFLMLRSFRIPPVFAMLSTLIYCVHPLFVSSIAWIPARGDLLLMVFTLMSFLFLIKHIQTKKSRYLILHWLSFSTALFCKETAVVLPVLYALYLISFSNAKSFDKKYLILFGLYLISGTCWFLLRSNAINGSSNTEGVMSLFAQNEKVGIGPFLSNLRTIPESLAKFIIPFDMAPIPRFSFAKTSLGIVLIAAMFSLLFYNKERSQKEKLFGLLWFLLLLTPTMLFKHQAIDYLDHRFFLPLIGILLFALFLIPRNWMEITNILNYWFLVAFLILLSTVTFMKSHPYAEPMAFYDDAISKNADCVFAYNNRGALYHKQGQLDDAIRDYSNAIDLKPDYVSAYTSRGNAYLSQQLYDKAIADYTKVIELNYADANTYINRGAAYIHLLLYDKACSDFRKAEELGSVSASKNIARFCNRRNN